jgi:AraC family transcriptional regulator
VLKQVQPALAFAATHLDEDVSLAALAGQAGLSQFHLHRLFSAAAGETPKQYTSRLRLDQAAAMLLTTSDSVLNVALACGFQSHETFCRAFRRRYGMAPSAYRERGFASEADRAQIREHAALVSNIGPCVRLFQIREDGKSEKAHMAYSITKKTIVPQPVLVARRRVKPSEIAKTLAETFPQIAIFAQRNGLALAGPPLTRYIEWGPGVLTIEAGMPVIAHTGIAAEGDLRAETLPGGSVATTTHSGSYDKLTEAHAAVQQWLEAEGLAAAGAPWESYVTDPADYPDPKDWKTEIFWPLA